MDLRLLFWSLRHRKRRQLLNVIVISLTAAVIVVFVSTLSELLSFVRNTQEHDLRRLLVTSTVGAPTFPASFASVLDGIEGVKIVQRYRVTEGGFETGSPYFVLAEEESWATTPDPIFNLDPEVRAAWVAKKPRGAIASGRVAKALNLTVGKVVQVPTSEGPLELEIVGIAPDVKFPILVVHFSYLTELSKEPGQVSFRVYTGAADEGRVGRAIIERSRQTAYRARAVNESQMMNAWVEDVSMIPVVFGFLGIFLALMTGATLANNAAISIRERRVELATLRVLGFRPRRLLRLLLAEVLVTGLVSAGIAIGALHLLLPSGVSLATDGMLLKNVEFGGVGIGAGIATALVLPTLGALPSALRALRTPLFRALRD